MPSKRTTGTWVTGCAAAVVAAAMAFGQAATRPATSPTTTPAAATQPAEADVASLIRRLGGDDDADRDDAQQQLVDLGSTVVDPLRQAANQDPDLEVRSRSAAALAQIRDRDANGPTLVTLHVREAALASVLSDLGKQAHAQITQPYANMVGRAAAATVSLDVDRRPFWEVMADVCGQASVCPLPLETTNHARLQLYSSARNWLAKGPHQVSGPFCIGVSGLYHMLSVDVAGPPVTDDLFFVRLVVFPEPKLVVTQMSPLTVREATDELGNSLVPPATPGMMRALGRLTAGRVPARTVEARLRYPPDHPGRRIATLAGDLTVTLAQGAQRFEADDVMGRPTVTRPLPGVKVRVSVAHPSAGIYYQVTVECVRDGMTDPQWVAMTNRLGDLSVEDAAGHPLTSLNNWSADAGNTDASFKATGLFGRTNPGNNMLMNRVAAVAGNNPAAPVAPPPPGEPARVVWNVATRFKVVTVPVAFHDLPMP